jgi:hypothetical protein
MLTIYSNVIGIIGSKERKEDYEFVIIQYELFRIYKANDWIVAHNSSSGTGLFAYETAREKKIPIILLSDNEIYKISQMATKALIVCGNWDSTKPNNDIITEIYNNKDKSDLENIIMTYIRIHSDKNLIFC